jgi:hypothetical protein
MSGENYMENLRIIPGEHGEKASDVHTRNKSLHSFPRVNAVLSESYEIQESLKYGVNAGENSVFPLSTASSYSSCIYI